MEYKTIAIKIYYLLYENIVLKCNQQKCFLCEGDGQVYPFAGKKEIDSECPACKGFKYISIYYKRCLKCGGDGKDYPFPGKKEFQLTVYYVKEKDT